MTGAVLGVFVIMGNDTFCFTYGDGVSDVDIQLLSPTTIFMAAWPLRLPCSPQVATDSAIH